MILMSFLGMLIEGILIFIVVIIHELGHVIVAKRLKYQVESIELLPIGGVATISETHYKSSSDEWFIAGAGPFNNLLFIIVLIFYKELIPHSTTLIEYNLTLFFFNLLPALPLDGGRLLKAYLTKDRPYQEAKKVAAALGIIVGLLILSISGYYLLTDLNNSVYLSILGLFLTISAFKEYSNAKYLPVRLGFSKETSLSEIVEGKVIICPLNSPIRVVMKEIETNRNLVICIVDSRGEVVDMITEKIIVEEYKKGNGAKTLQDVIA